MDFLTLAKKRFSVRKFEDRPVEKEAYDAIIEAGRWAPTAKNIQPFKVYALCSEAALEKIRAITPVTFHAPVVLILCEDTPNAWVNPFDDFNSSSLDMGIFVSHLMMEAEELGLGTTCVCWFDTAKVKKEFAIPGGLQPRILLPVGYPAADVQPGPMHPHRKEASELVEEL